MLGYLSVKDMAERTGLSQERVRQLIRTHQIRRAIKLGGWWVREEDFDAFLKTRIYDGSNGEEGPNGQNGPNGNGPNFRSNP